MSVDEERFASAIVDQAIAIAAIPWPCPSEVGPDERYRLEELVAVGRASLVYRATDLLLSSQGYDATVAVKIVPRRDGQRSEALPARRVEHPNIARVLDRGRLDHGHDFTVVEFVSGGTLADLAPRWEPAEAAEFMIKVARGIQAAHSAGVSHLDLKPSNILLAEEREPKVTDFGLARLDHEEEGAPRGNLAFMSPEQGRREAGSLTPPSDIYALGGLLFYLIRGEPPNGIDEAAIERRHTEPAPAPPLRIDRDLDRICARALAPAPTDRYDSAGQLADDLQRWLEHKPLDWTRPPLWHRARLWSVRHPAEAVALVAGVLVVAIALTFWQVDQRRRANQQRLILEETQRELEKLKATTRPMIHRFATMLADNPREELATSLVWLDLLYDFAMLTEDDRLLDGEALREPLVQLVDDLEASGQSQSLECLLARSTLAHWHLRAGDEASARRELDLVEQRWADVVPEEDSHWVRHRAMRVIADGIAAAKAKRLGRPEAEALRSARAELERVSPGGKLTEMIDDLLRRARKG